MSFSLFSPFFLLFAFPIVLTLETTNFPLHKQYSEKVRNLFLTAVREQHGGDPKVAISYYHKVIAEEPNFVEAYNNLGVAYRTANESELAITFLKRATELSPTYTDAHYSLGNTYYDIGDHEKGILCFRKVLELNPQHYKALINLGSGLLLLKRYDESIEKLLKYVQQFPNLPEGYYYLGKNYKSLKDLSTAMEYFEKAVKLGMKFADCWYSLAELHFQGGNFKRAVFYYENIPENNYTFSNLAIHYGISLANEGRIAKATTVLKSALTKEGNEHDEALFYYGEILVISKQSDEGIEKLKQVSQLKNKLSLRSDLMLGLVYEQLYKEEEAYVYYNNVIKNGSATMEDILYFLVRRTSCDLLEPLEEYSPTATFGLLMSLTRSLSPEYVSYRFAPYIFNLPTDLSLFQSKKTTYKYWMNIPLYPDSTFVTSRTPKKDDLPSVAYPTLVSLKAGNVTHYLRWYGALISTSPFRVYVAQNPIMVPLGSNHLPDEGKCFGDSDTFISEFNKILLKSHTSLSEIRYQVRSGAADAVLLMMRREAPTNLTAGYTFVFGHGYHVVRGDYAKLKQCSFDNCFHPFFMDYTLDDYNVPHLRGMSFSNLPPKLSCKYGSYYIHKISREIFKAVLMEVSQRKPQLYNAYDKVIRSTYHYYGEFSDYISETELQMIFEYMRIEQVTPNMMLSVPSNYLVKFKNYIMPLEAYTTKWMINRLKKFHNNTETLQYIRSIEMKGSPKITTDSELLDSYLKDPINHKFSTNYNPESFKSKDK